MKRETNYHEKPNETPMEHRKTEWLKNLGNSNGIAVAEVERYLGNYRTYARMIEMNRYEANYFASATPAAGMRVEESEAYLQGKLYEIRSFILSIPKSDETLFLYYHYVHGESVDRCGELLGVSRATAYRVRVRALKIAAFYYAEWQKRVC